MTIAEKCVVRRKRANTVEPQIPGEKGQILAEFRGSRNLAMAFTVQFGVSDGNLPDRFLPGT
jgi:hypothetical protein